MPVSKPPYPDYKFKSGWNALLPARIPNPELAEKIEVDVAIVGAGFTGISAAKRWRELQPEATIALLDSSEIGEGNPGRNSGFLLEISLAEDADAKNIEKMAASNKLISETMQHIVTEVQNSGVDCDIKRAGTYRAAASNIGKRSLKKYQGFLETAKLPFEKLDKSELNTASELPSIKLDSILLIVTSCNQQVLSEHWQLAWQVTSIYLKTPLHST